VYKTVVCLVVRTVVQMDDMTVQRTVDEKEDKTVELMAQQLVFPRADN
jgi:hypothetical protein